MSSLKQFVVQAILKVTVDPKYADLDFKTREEARDHFIAAVVAELFPEDAQTVVLPVAAPEPVATPAPAPAPAPDTKEVKVDKKASKEAEKAAKEEAKKAAKEAEKAAKEEAKKAEKAAKEEAKKAEKAAKDAAEKAAKEAAKEAEKAAKEAEKAAKEAEKAAKEPVKEAEKPKKAKKEAAPSSSNLAKIDPTWRKTLKEADKDHAKELEPELLKYLNAMSKESFNARGAKDHVADFLASRQGTNAAAEAVPEPAAAEAEEVDFEVVEFQGKEYYVNPDTKRVYEGEMDEDGNLKVTRPVGYVGMADFKEMELPE